MRETYGTLKSVVLLALTLNTLFLISNGVFMLVDPKTWYEVVPGVTTTGFYNQHFIRDIGIVQLFLGMAFALGWYYPKERLLLWGMATLWLMAHASFHIWEVAVGICGVSALIRDFAAVSLPPLIGVTSLYFEKK